MLIQKDLIALRRTPDLILWTLGLLLIAIYILILIPYYSNDIYAYSDYALRIGAYDYHDSEVAQGPDIEDIYGSPALGHFSFWFGTCASPCLLLPLIALQAFVLLNHWHNFSSKGKTLRILLHFLLVVMAIVGFLHLTKFAAWMEI